MCNAHKIPAPPPPPPPPQAAKAPLSIDPKRRQKQMTGGFTPTTGGTLLTGAAGAGTPTTGSSTLLGG